MKKADCYHLGYVAKLHGFKGEVSFFLDVTDPNEYTKLDPTLPRIYNVRCPNGKCATNAENASKPAEVIYMRYDDANLKYIYICSS